MNQFIFERKELQILYPTRTNSWFVLKQMSRRKLESLMNNLLESTLSR